MRKGMEATLFVLMLILLCGCGQSPDGTPFDPNLAAIQDQQQAQLHGAMATGTMESKILPITQTSAAFSFSATQVSVEMTQAAALWTATPSPVPTITPTPTYNATMTKVYLQSVLDAHNVDMQIKRDEINNTMRAVFLYAFAALLAAVGLLYAYVHLKRLSFSTPNVDDWGKPLPLLNYVDAVVTDLDKATNGTVAITQKYLAQLPAVTAERQDRVTARAQMVDAATRSRLSKRLLEGNGLTLLPNPDEEVQDVQDSEILLPEWKIINGWDGQSRPLGLGRKGIIVAQAASPHLLVSGKTRSGKTLFMLRTQVTASLAKGYQVINLGFSDAGFGAFLGQPNFHSIQLNQASDIIVCLENAYNELKERKKILGGASYDWQHFPGGTPPRPFVDLLIDELGNLADDIYMSEGTKKEGAEKTAELWRWVSMIASEGGKFGIQFTAALQNPTAKSVDLRFRRNCTLVSFTQGDASQSSTFLGTTGAERLPVGHFMTYIDKLVVGGGFAPTDDEIKEYLSNYYPAVQTPKPTWIEGVIVRQPELPTQETIHLNAPAVSKTDFVNGLSGWEAEVLDLHEKGLEQEYIVAKVFADDNPEIGKAAVADLIQRWKAVKGNGESPVLGNEQPAVKSEIVQMAEAIRAKWTPGLSLNKTSELLGKPYAGNSWCIKVKQVVDYLTTTTTTDENRVISPDFGAVVV